MSLALHTQYENLGSAAEGSCQLLSSVLFLKLS